MGATINHKYLKLQNFRNILKNAFSPMLDSKILIASGATIGVIFQNSVTHMHPSSSAIGSVIIDKHLGINHQHASSSVTGSVIIDKLNHQHTSSFLQS